MRKLGNRIQDTQLAPVVTTRAAASWIPAASFALAALDPAHWSQRKQQANLWRLLERLQQQRVLH
jgi:hypothetical protein